VSYSLKKQEQTPRKIYTIDNGIAEAVAFKFSSKKGQYLENLVFIELKRQGKEILHNFPFPRFSLNFA